MITNTVSKQPQPTYQKKDMIIKTMAAIKSKKKKVNIRRSVLIYSQKFKLKIILIMSDLFF